MALRLDRELGHCTRRLPVSEREVQDRVKLGSTEPDTLRSACGLRFILPFILLGSTRPFLGSRVWGLGSRV
eukprot:526971-Rhodomonas_salina.5